MRLIYDLHNKAFDRESTTMASTNPELVREVVFMLFHSSLAIFPKYFRLLFNHRPKHFNESSFSFFFRFHFPQSCVSHKSVNYIFSIMTSNFHDLFFSSLFLCEEDTQNRNSITFRLETIKVRSKIWNEKALFSQYFVQIDYKVCKRSLHRQKKNLCLRRHDRESHKIFLAS